MELFEVRDGRAFPTVHALMIEPFKSISEADNSAQKGESIKIFTYIDLLCNPRKSNPFYYNYAPDERPFHVKKEVWGDNPPDATQSWIIIAAVKKYKELLDNSSITLSVLDSALRAVGELKNYLDTVNLKERTNGGAAVIKPRDVSVAISSLPELIKKIMEMRSKVHEELAQDTKTRNDREVGMYED